MLTNSVKIEKKKSLLTYKEKLLKELKYYESRINEQKNNVNKTNSFEDDASSDSDTDLSALPECVPAVGQLKHQETTLQTSLQATRELAGLDVLQAEVTVVLQEPDVQGESPIKEEGVWREVTAECCVDLVPFSITFYAHRAHRKFAPLLYRSLRVTPLKTAQEAELAKSVLPGLKRPSDAVEVLRSYAVAYRSRRSTLARLADKFGSALYMEPLAEGGYLLKCANLLEVSWTLQNKWSPIAPFHHRMKFDLEYMEESYIRQITASHRQLSEPSVDTNERTLLLSKILAACLRAAEVTGDVTDTGDVTGQASKVGGRRTTLDQEPEMPVIRNNKDSQVMAPPRSLPKKTKPTNKDATDDSRKSDLKPVKRSIQDGNTNENVKKPKVIEKAQENLSEMVEKYENKKTKEDIAKSLKNNKANTKNNEDKDVASAKNVAKAKNKEDKSVANDKNKEDKIKNQETTNNVASSKSKEDKNHQSSGQTKNDEANNIISDKNIVNGKNKGDKKTKNDGSKVASVKTKEGKSNVANDGDAVSDKNKSEKKYLKNDEPGKKVGKSVSNINHEGDTASKTVKTDTVNTKNAEKSDKNTKLTKKSNVPITKKVDTVESANLTEKRKKTDTQSKELAKHSIKDKNMAPKSGSLKRKRVPNTKNDDDDDKTTGVAAKKANTMTTNKNLNKDSNNDVINAENNKNKQISAKVIKTVKEITNENGEVIKKVVKKLANNKTDGSKPKVVEKPSVANEKTKEVASKTNNVAIEKKQASVVNKLDKVKKPLNEHPSNKLSKTAQSNMTKEPNIVKPKISTISSKSGNIKNAQTGSTEKENVKKNTKIPQKKIFSPKAVIKKAPIRVSPRKNLTKPKTPLVGKKVIQKPITGIPRLVAKPKPKIN